MHVLYGCLVAMALAPSGDPRAIDPAANRPEIIAPGGGAARAKPPKTRSPKVVSEPKVVPTPKVEPKAEPKLEPTPKAEPKPKVEPTPEPKPEPTPEPTPEPAPPQQRCFPERGRCWGLNVGGIVAASVGVGMLGTGIGFMQAPQFPVPDEPISNYSLRPPGVVLVALGTATVVTGILMIVSGHAVHGKPTHSGRDARTARVQLFPGGLRW